MTADDIIEALALPAQARLDKRVPKKHLIENGSPTAGDRRAISDGVEQLLWIAALKPATASVPAYKDELREYLEIAVLSLTLRPSARAGRLRDLVHRAIPYPVVLLSVQESEVVFSLAHIRHAQNELAKVVLDGDMEAIVVSDHAVAKDFVANLAMAGLPNHNLYHLYQGWMDRLIALAAAGLTDRFVLSKTPEAIEMRKNALREIERLDGVLAELRAAAEKEKQLSRLVDLNINIRRHQAEKTRYVALLG